MSGCGVGRGETMASFAEDVARRKEAAQRILEVAAELHLTWREFERVIEFVKETAYLSSGDESASNS